MKMATLFLAVTFGICLFGVIFIFRQVTLVDPSGEPAARAIATRTEPALEKTKPDDIAEVKPYESQVKDPKTKIQVEEMKSRIGNVKNLINQRSHQD
jgi:hypothetical protein